jgi:nucleoside-diphosphate-sugar epimerase
MDPTRKIFLTGATGIVGRALLQRLAGDKRSAGKGMPKVIVLSRNVSAFPEAGVQAVIGKLSEPGEWGGLLEGCTEVVHLAALTGKAKASEFTRVNVGGTRTLIEECRKRGVRRFLYCSSIAAKYPELDHYPYGRSKREAEQVVRESGLDWAIVRPTIVLNRRARNWHALHGLAKLPVVPLFGGGRARIQPVHADDVGEALVAWIEDPSLDRGEYDLGGPDVVTFRDFLGRVHVRAKRSKPLYAPLPGKLGIAMLGGVEGALLPVLPMTAGQLYAFVYDSTAEPNRLTERVGSARKGVEAILDDLFKYE